MLTFPPFQRGITIDSPHSLDLDDAIHLERTERGLHLTVTVPDLSAAVPSGGAIDAAARARAFTRYAGTRTRAAMLPDEITGRASLLPDGRRPGIAFDIALDTSLQVTSFSLRRVIFESAGRFSHADAEEALRAPGAAHHRMLSLAWEVTEALLESRRRSGALAIYDLRTGWMTTEEGRLIRIEPGRAHQGHLIVQELMILTNRTVAKHARAAGIPILFRNHAPWASQEGGGERLREMVASATGGRSEPVSGSRYGVLVRSLGRAAVGLGCLGHFGLAVDAYCHVTSPLRRYADFVNQRALLAWADGRPAPYSLGGLRDAAERCNAVEEELRLAVVAGFKASVHRAAEHSLRHRRFADLKRGEFRQLLRIVGDRGDDGKMPLGNIKAEFRRRLAVGELTVQDVGVALLDAGTVLGADTVKRIMGWLRNKRGASTGLWTHLMQREGWPEIGFECVAAGEPDKPIFYATGSVVIEGEPISATAAAGERRLAEQLATFAIIGKIVGYEMPVVAAHAPDKQVRPVQGGPPPDDPKGRLLNDVAVRRGWSVTFHLASQSGPPHAPVFRMIADVRHGDEQLIAAEGTGSNKRAAEKAAAAMALEMLG